MDIKFYVMDEFPFTTIMQMNSEGKTTAFRLSLDRIRGLQGHGKAFFEVLMTEPILDFSDRMLESPEPTFSGFNPRSEQLLRDLSEMYEIIKKEKMAENEE